MKKNILMGALLLAVTPQIINAKDSNNQGRKKDKIDLTHVVSKALDKALAAEHKVDERLRIDAKKAVSQVVKEHAETERITKKVVQQAAAEVETSSRTKDLGQTLSHVGQSNKDEKYKRNATYRRKHKEQQAFEIAQADGWNDRRAEFEDKMRAQEERAKKQLITQERQTLCDQELAKIAVQESQDAQAELDAQRQDRMQDKEYFRQHDDQLLLDDPIINSEEVEVEIEGQCQDGIEECDDQHLLDDSGSTSKSAAKLDEQSHVRTASIGKSDMLSDNLQSEKFSIPGVDMNAAGSVSAAAVLQGLSYSTQQLRLAASAAASANLARTALTLQRFAPGIGAGVGAAAVGYYLYEKYQTETDKVVEQLQQGDVGLGFESKTITQEQREANIKHRNAMRQKVADFQSGKSRFPRVVKTIPGLQKKDNAQEVNLTVLVSERLAERDALQVQHGQKAQEELGQHEAEHYLKLTAADHVSQGNQEKIMQQQVSSHENVEQNAAQLAFDAQLTDVVSTDVVPMDTQNSENIDNPVIASEQNMTLAGALPEDKKEESTLTTVPVVVGGLVAVVGVSGYAAYKYGLFENTPTFRSSFEAFKKRFNFKDFFGKAAHVAPEKNNLKNKRKMNQS